MTGRNRRLLSLGLSAALLLALAFAVVVTLLDPGASAVGSTQESAARKEVQRVASAFAVNVNTYSSDSFDTYRSRVRPLLTDDFGQEFDKTMQGLLTQLQSAQLESDGEVLVTGVSAIDQDSATVLVVSDAEVSSAAGSRARHFRWEVDLVRQEGKWLVNEFRPM